MLYMKEKTPEISSKAIVVGLCCHATVKICTSVNSLPIGVHDGGGGLAKRKTNGDKKMVAGIAIYAQVSSTLNLRSPRTPARAKFTDPQSNEQTHANTPKNWVPESVAEWVAVALADVTLLTTTPLATLCESA